MRNRIQSAPAACYRGTTSCFAGCATILYSFLCLSGGRPSSATPVNAHVGNPTADARISGSTSLDAEPARLEPSAPPLLSDRERLDAHLESMRENISGVQKVGYGDRDLHPTRVNNTDAQAGHHDFQPMQTHAHVCSRTRLK